MGLSEDLGGRLAYFDSNLFIYFLEAHPRFPTLNNLFAQVETCEVNAITSQLTLAEVLVKPFQDGNLTLQSQCHQFIRTRDGLRLRAVTKDVLVEAARLRAVHGFRLPDAIHLATALDAGCQVFLTNDRRLRNVAGLEVLYLDRYAES